MSSNVLTSSGLWHFGKFLSLKPYGDTLLSPAASFWIVFARLIIAIMATMEALSWGYVGTLLGQDSGQEVVFGVLLGLIVFAVVWSVDVSLVTLDISSYRRRSERRKAEQDKENYPTDTNAKEAKTQEGSLRDSVTEFIRWPLIPVGIRSGLVVISILVTAPFVSLFILKADIDKELDDTFQTAYKVVKNQLEASAAEELNVRSLRRQQAEAQVQAKYSVWVERDRKATLEVAGKGDSGIYGPGPAASAAQRSATEAKAEYERARLDAAAIANDQSETPSAAKLKQLEIAAKSNDAATLKASFGIQESPVKSFKSRNDILLKFESRPEYKRIEYSVFSLLTFVVVALFLQKYFEPRSVRVYFDEERQGQWNEYVSCKYDSFLEEADRSSFPRVNGISPLSFCHLWDEKIASTLNDKDHALAMMRVAAVETAQAPKLRELEEAEEQSKGLISQIAAQNRLVEEANADRLAQEEKASALRKAAGDIRRSAEQLMFSAGSVADGEIAQNINKRLEHYASEIALCEARSIERRASIGAIRSQIDRDNQQLRTVKIRINSLEDDLTPVLDLLRYKQRTEIALARASLDQIKR